MKGTTNLIPLKLQPLPTRCVPVTKGSRLVSEPLAPMCICDQLAEILQLLLLLSVCHSCPQFARNTCLDLSINSHLLHAGCYWKCNRLKIKSEIFSDVFALALGPTCTTSIANSVFKQVCINYSNFLATKETTTSFVGAPPSFWLVLPSDCRQTPGTNSPASQGIHTFFFFIVTRGCMTFNTLDTWHHARNLIK